MKPSLTRRSLLSGVAAIVATSAAAQSQDPLIIRPEIHGVDPRYAAYATPGDYLYPTTPLTVRMEHSDVVVFSPRNVKEARLVVFSHGALSDPLTYRDLLWHWVSHGFVVAAPLHADAVIEGGPTLRKTKAGAVSEWPISALLEDPSAWKQRIEACAGILDDMSFLEATTGITILRDRIIIAGHGYGAYVAQLLLGAEVTDGEGQRRSFADPRFFAGIALSPQGPGVMGLDETSWSDMSAPTLFMVAENDQDFTGQPAKEKARAYRLAKPGYKHIGYLRKGSTHTFIGTQSSAHEKKLFEVVKAMSVAYLRAYGNYEEAAFRDMTSDFFERMSLGVVNEDRR